MAFDDIAYLVNQVVLQDGKPTIEDFILLTGTLVAFIAFVLWCCFPIQPKEPNHSPNRSNNRRSHFSCNADDTTTQLQQQSSSSRTAAIAHNEYSLKNANGLGGGGHCCT